MTDTPPPPIKGLRRKEARDRRRYAQAFVGYWVSVQTGVAGYPTTYTGRAVAVAVPNTGLGADQLIVDSENGMWPRALSLASIDRIEVTPRP